MIRTNIRINIWIKNIRIFEYSNIFVTLCFVAIYMTMIERPLYEVLSPFLFFFLNQPSSFIFQLKQKTDPNKHIRQDLINVTF